MNTSLAKIKSNGPCLDRWKHLLEGLGKTKADDEPLSYIQILDINGLADAYWSLKCLEFEHDFIVRLYAARVAESWLPYYNAVYPKDKRVAECIRVARSFALREASWSELEAAGVEACVAARRAFKGRYGSASLNAFRSAEMAALLADKWGAWNAYMWPIGNTTDEENAKALFRDYFTEARSPFFYRETEGSNA